MEIDPLTDVAGTLDATDRRRPGRLDDANPELVGLLRGTTDVLIAPDKDDDSNPLAPSRGLAVAVGLSAIFWVLAMGLIFLGLY